MQQTYSSVLYGGTVPYCMSLRERGEKWGVGTVLISIVQVLLSCTYLAV